MALSHRSFPNSSPASLKASTTPSVKKMSASPGLSSSAAENRCVVARVDVGKTPRDGIEFTQDRRREAPAFKAVPASVPVQSRHEFRERRIFSGDGSQAGLQRGHQESGGNN